MELKRILAQDARSANKKAAALYGGDVMVISCNKVGSQTELIVAVDSPQQEAAPAVPTASAEPAVLARPAEETLPFAQALDMAKRAPEPSSDAHPQQTQETPSGAPAAVTAHSLVSQAQEALERVRGQELVSLVREEIASLRREFHLSRLGGDVTGDTGPSSTIRLLHEALIECHAPAALRASLIDGLLDCKDLDQALKAIEARLSAILGAAPAPALHAGIHALCGPSGAGKTLMTHRILAAASRKMPIEEMALISYADHKPGSWSQVQILAAQTGIEAYRARDPHALGLLLEELCNRKLVVIDTAGSAPLQQAMELVRLEPRCAVHAVVPADASSEQFRRLHSEPDLKWQSLMLSKADDQPNPWPMLGFVSGRPMAISAIARSDKIQEDPVSEGKSELVRWAMTKLQTTLEQTAAAGIQMPAALPRPVTKTAARTTKPRAARAVKSTPAPTKSAAPIPCLQ